MRCRPRPLAPAGIERGTGGTTQGTRGTTQGARGTIEGTGGTTQGTRGTLGVGMRWAWRTRPESLSKHCSQLVSEDSSPCPMNRFERSSSGSHIAISMWTPSGTRSSSSDSPSDMSTPPKGHPYRLSKNRSCASWETAGSSSKAPCRHPRCAGCASSSDSRSNTSQSVSRTKYTNAARHILDAGSRTRDRDSGTTRVTTLTPPSYWTSSSGTARATVEGAPGPAGGDGASTWVPWFPRMVLAGSIASDRENAH